MSDDRVTHNEDGSISYLNEWHAEYGCKMPAIILTEWIYTDKDLELYQNWLDKKGES